MCCFCVLGILNFRTDVIKYQLLKGLAPMVFTGVITPQTKFLTLSWKKAPFIA